MPSQKLNNTLPQVDPVQAQAKRIQDALNALKSGGMVILVDSEDRENEGDLVLAAEFATAGKINFLIRQACGLVCLALKPEHIDRLGLKPMVSVNETPRQTAFTVSIEAAKGVDTGISPQDRAHTILVASSSDAKAVDIISPGHVFPLRAVEGGVLARAGHTEGSIELCEMAGLNSAAVICEIINEDGTMARREDLQKFSTKHSIPMVTIEDLIAYRTIQSTEEKDQWMIPSESAVFPTGLKPVFSDSLRIQSFKNRFTQVEHAVVKTAQTGEIPLVRVHSECLTGDALGSLRCDCGDQLQLALKEISADAQGGMLLYLKNQEGRGIGLWNKIQAYALQDQGKDTFDANLELGFHADVRRYHEAAKILLSLGVKKVRLLTNNPHKVSEMQRFGIEVVEQVPLKAEIKPENRAYLKAKQDRFQHSLNLN